VYFLSFKKYTEELAICIQHVPNFSFHDKLLYSPKQIGTFLVFPQKKYVIMSFQFQDVEHPFPVNQNMRQLETYKSIRQSWHHGKCVSRPHFFYWHTVRSLCYSFYNNKQFSVTASTQYPCLSCYITSPSDITKPK